MIRSQYEYVEASGFLSQVFTFNKH